MTNTEIIATIRNEIEKQIKDPQEHCYGVSSFNKLRELLDFIESLEEKSEKPSEGLEEEIAGMYQALFGTDIINRKEMLYLDTFEAIARHFYDLGCRRTAEKYDEIEYNRQREEGRVLPGFEDESKGIHGKDFVPVEWVETLEMYGKWKIVKLEEDGSSESVPKDLNEAAEKYLDELFGKGKHHPFYKELFIAGAKWQAEQLLKSSPLPEDTVLFNKGVEEGKRLMMEEAVEGLFQNTPFPTICLDDCKDYNFKDNQKVCIIIVKEN